MSSTELLYELVKIPSTSTNEREISIFLENKLVDLGMEITRSGNSLIGKLGRGRPTLMLCGHLDTVPPFFPPQIKGTRLFGRGAADDKGGLAAVINAIARVEQSKLKGTLLTTLVVDEELKSQGAQDILPYIEADFGVVCEPTNLKIVNGHKGRMTFYIETIGKSAHASKPELGKNAIVAMAKLVVLIDEMRLIKHPVLGSETLTVSAITGGDAPNIVPDRCRIGVDYRYVPPHDASSVLEMLKAKLPEAKIEFAEDLKNFSRPFYLSNHEIITLLDESIRFIGENPQVVTMDASTDASRFNEAGIPTVVFGPGDIAQAHTTDEWIDLREVETASAIFRELIKRVLMA
ncbi:MAG: M20 family metallopeptidase [Halobacteriota archaeon]|jgi:acetylornithine deacetylase